MKNKLTIAITVFLILIPLRLPISILFIHFFEWILAITPHQEVIPLNVLATNVIVSKMIYNIALSALFIYNIEKFSIEKLKRKAKDSYGESVYWWTIAIGILLVAFIVIDGISVYKIFFIK